MKLGLVAVVIALSLSCTPEPEKPDPLARPCDRACANLQIAGCPEGEDFKGISCVTVCEENGPLLNVACLATTEATPEKLRACGRLRCQK